MKDAKSAEKLAESWIICTEKFTIEECWLAGHAAGIAEMREWRDAYAESLEVALREGIFINKERVKRDIEQLLAPFKALAGEGK